MLKNLFSLSLLIFWRSTSCSELFSYTAYVTATAILTVQFMRTNVTQL